MRVCLLALACLSCTTFGSRVRLRRRQNHSVVEFSESRASEDKEVTNPIISFTRLLLTSPAAPVGFIPRFGGRLTQSNGDRIMRKRAAYIQVSLKLDDGDDELDAFDTSDSWDEQAAAQAAWEKSESVAKGGDVPPPPVDYGWAVDEEAHYDLGDDDEDEPLPKDPLSVLRQVTQAKSSAPASAPASVAGSPNTVTLTVSVDPDTVMVNKVSLASVLTTLMRIEEKVDKLIKKVDKLESSPVSTASAAASSVESDTGGWNGEIDEMAYFDDDPDDD